MAGLVIYSVNPRSLGALPEWMAAVLEAERLGCTAIHLMPFHPTTALRGAGGTGNLYAIRDHFTLNTEFCGEVSQAAAWYRLRDFVKMARARNIAMVADLDFRTLAADHPAAIQHPDFFKSTTADLAEIDYENPAAWDYFLGEDGYWLRAVAGYLDLGFNAFRCNAANRIPPLVWERVLNYALRRAPDTLMIASAPGITAAEAAQLREVLREFDSRMLFDLIEDDISGAWDFQDPTAFRRGRADRLDAAAHDGTIGMADVPGERPRAARWRAALAGDGAADDKIAAACIRDYAVACFTNPAVLLPRAYAWCVEDHAGLYDEGARAAEFFKSMKQARKTAPSPLSLGPAIAEMHRLRAQLPAQMTIEFSRVDLPIPKETNLFGLQCDYTAPGSKTLAASFILLLNTAPERGTQQFPENWWKDLRTENTGAQRFHFGIDRNARDQISGVAILMIPGGLHMSRHLNPANRAAPRPTAAEPALVA